MRFVKVTVTDWGSSTRPPRRALCQNDDRREPSTALAACRAAVLDALTVHPCGLSGTAYGMNAAGVGISMCFIELPMDPELPVAPEPRIIAAELASIASELAGDREPPIVELGLPAAGAPPAARSTAMTTINN